MRISPETVTNGVIEKGTLVIQNGLNLPAESVGSLVVFEPYDGTYRGCQFL